MCKISTLVKNRKHCVVASIQDGPQWSCFLHSHPWRVSPLVYYTRGWSLLPIEYGRSDDMELRQISLQKNYSFCLVPSLSLSLSFIVCSEGSQLAWETHMVGNWSLLPTATWVNLDMDIPSLPSLRMTTPLPSSWLQPPSQNHPGELLLDSWPSETVCYHKWLLC